MIKGPAASTSGTPLAGLLRTFACLAALAGLAACSSGPPVSPQIEAAQYRAKARGDYKPPGPPGDPWGPYILEASAKYDMPERWIREVIRAESSGKVMDTSAPGAMGLMQLMPATYDELRSRYSLDDDPYEPHDNIMAGTAYLREMYDVYGSPGFLAAYNAGPGRLDDYLNRRKPLPDETRNYVAKIGPRIQGVDPVHPSSGGMLAMNQIPIYIPKGPRYPSRTPYQAPVALADNRRSGVSRAPVQMASLEPPHQPPAQIMASIQTAPIVPPPPASRGGFRFIPQAMADTMPHQSGGATNWAVQVGAFANEGMARSAAETARGKAQVSAQSAVGTRKQGSTTLYRARLVGLSRDNAVQACERLSKSHTSCIVLSPDAQS